MELKITQMNKDAAEELGMWRIACGWWNRNSTKKKGGKAQSKTKEDQVRIMSRGVKSENDLKPEKNAEDNKRNC